MTRAYIPKAIGAVYLLTRTAGPTTGTYHRAANGKGHTARKIAPSHANNNNGTARKETRQSGYTSDHKDGRIVVPEPGGTGATTEDLNHAKVDTGKAHTLDAAPTPSQANTHQAAGRSKPAPTATSQPRSVEGKGETIGT
jgi:hypothetical protein